MNVLKALNKNYFNKVLIDVIRIDIINPYKLKIIASNIKYEIREPNKIPFQCILNDENNSITLDNLISISSSVLKDHNILAINNNYSRICEITFSKKLNDEQIHELLLLNAQYDINYYFN